MARFVVIVTGLESDQIKILKRRASQVCAQNIGFKGLTCKPFHSKDLAARFVPEAALWRTRLEFFLISIVWNQ
jgi:hypothetical protein